MLKLFILGSILFSSSSFAQNDLSDISASNPNATRWEILKQFYERSSSQAHLSDFDKIEDTKSNQKCRLALPNSTPDTLLKVFVRQIARTIPGDGPLFPSTTIIKLNFANEAYLDKIDSANKGFDYITVSDDSYDLKITQAKNAGHADSPFKLLLRKNGDMISFKRLNYKNNEDNGPIFEKDIEDSYGYCWRE